MGEVVKKHNHLYPAFHIRKWMDNNGKIYDKVNKENIKWQSQELFTKDYYYSLGEKNEMLEDRIAKFEGYIGKIIKRVDESDDFVELSAKELEILKLYCVLTACRQEYTTEVINSDESGIYRSNNYLFGIPKLFKQEDVVDYTARLMDSFERLLNKPDDYKTYIGPHFGCISDFSCISTIGTHLAIARSEENRICISDRFAIIENTMDSDHLYTYIPVSPKTALFLVKTKYYYDNEVLEYTKHRLARKQFMNYFPNLSMILDDYDGYDYEKTLLCSYRQDKRIYPTKVRYVGDDNVSQVKVKIETLPNKIIDRFNRIFFEDGNYLLFSNDYALESAKKLKLACRDIKLVYN